MMFIIGFVVGIVVGAYAHKTIKGFINKAGKKIDEVSTDSSEKK